MGIFTPMVQVSQPGALATNGDEKSYYLSRDSLTFPGVAAAAGTILQAIDSTPGKMAAFLIAVVLGGGLVALGYQQTPQSERSKPGFALEAGLMGILNVGLLWVAILGVAIVTGGTTPPP